MKTVWRASEFQKTAMVKIPIDMPFSPSDFERRLKPTWMWCWDTESVKVQYTKCADGLNKLITIDGTKDYYDKDKIENHFNTL